MPNAERLPVPDTPQRAESNRATATQSASPDDTGITPTYDISDTRRREKEPEITILRGDNCPSMLDYEKFIKKLDISKYTTQTAKWKQAMFVLQLQEGWCWSKLMKIPTDKLMS